MALNCNLPDLCLLSSWDYRHESLCSAITTILKKRSRNDKPIVKVKQNYKTTQYKRRLKKEKITKNG
jgi:hypothetical protein